MKKFLFVSAIVASIICSSRMSPASPDPDTGIEGVISITPVTGGPVRQGAPDSRPLPNMEFAVMKGEERVASFQTDAEGHFKVSLEPGHYQISKAGPKVRVGYWGPFEIDVVEGQIAKVQWKCDSGMQ